MKVKKSIAKSMDYLIIFVSGMIIAGLLYIGWHGLNGLIQLINLSPLWEGKMFFVFLTFASAGGWMYFVELWIRAIDAASKRIKAMSPEKK